MIQAAKIRLWLVLLCAPLSSCTAPEPAGGAGVAPGLPPPATLSNSRSYRLHANHLGEQFVIDVAMPFTVGSTPAALPVVYVLDGNGMFAMVAQLVRLMELGGELPPLLIVGIGYQAESVAEVLHKRTRDLTPTVDTVENDTSGGGADQFLAFINDELKPFIATQFNVDPNDTTLVGDSLGGLFAMYVLFTQPDAFYRYVAGSPSLWWDQGTLFEAERQRAAVSEDIAARLFLAVGAMEDDGVVRGPRDFALVRNVERLTAILRGRAYPGLSFEAVIFPAETHLSVIPATMSRGLRSVFAEPPP